MHSELEARSGGGTVKACWPPRTKQWCQRTINSRLAVSFYLPKERAKSNDSNSIHSGRRPCLPVGQTTIPRCFCIKEAGIRARRAHLTFRLHRQALYPASGPKRKSSGWFSVLWAKGGVPQKPESLGGFLSADFLPLEILFLRRLCIGRLDHRILYFLCARHWLNKHFLT